MIGASTYRAFELPAAGALSIGRHESSDVVLDDGAASRHHARLMAASGEVRIVDRDSRHGTHVNGVRIDGSQILSNGDQIAIGGVMFVIHLPQQVPLAPAASDVADLTVTRIVLGDREVIIGDPVMSGIYELLARLGPSELSVLVCGETGVGKENAAFAVHHYSPRRAGPFIAINCAAIPEALAEAELFGFEKGAFTHALAPKPGLFEVTAGGTIFLDEVGELSLAVQAKLLRVVQTRRVTRVGGLREREIDVRIVAATNRDLEAEVDAGRFRKDLLFRLNDSSVVLPPLRARPREIGVLARAFLDAACRRGGRAPLALSTSAMRWLQTHAWPGNVRELEKAMRYAAVVVTSDCVEERDLRLAVEQGRGRPPLTVGAGPQGVAPPINEELRRLEEQRMRDALDRCGGVHTRAAALIGMPIRTFTSKVKRYGLVVRHEQAVMTARASPLSTVPPRSSRADRPQ
jgi:transcriptional regulator with GAF, ATPase, and Fis domain